jgi:hypothetical protein
MTDIKPGDWVLVDHHMLYDAYVVRRVVSVTAKKFVGEIECPDRIDGPYWRQDNARNRTNIKGVFPGENAALSAIPALTQLYHAKLASEKAVKIAFHAASKALLDPS